jgi:MGT family glycosyltransferase
VSRRFLILPFGPPEVLAHVGSCLAVAEHLQERGHQVEFGYGGKVPEAIERAGFTWHPLPEVSRTFDLAGSFDVGGWYPTSEDLAAAVQARIDLIERFGPDAAVTDCSIPGRIACEATGVPDLSINHYLIWMPQFRRRRDVLGSQARLLFRPRQALAAARLRFGRVESREEGALPGIGGPAEAALVRRINDVRASFGLPPIESIQIEGWGGKMVACTSTPFLDPAPQLPSHARYVGPVSWAGTGDGPAPQRRDRPLIFVSQGSTGLDRFLRQTVEELGPEPVDVAVATAGLCDPGELMAAAPNVQAHRYLPHRAWLEAADVAVIHGGLMTVGDAHRAGTPTVVIPSIRDHLITAGRVQRLGVGISLWPAPGAGEIGRAVQRLLTRPRYRQRAAELAGRLRDGWDGGTNAADLTEELAAGRT